MGSNQVPEPSIRPATRRLTPGDRWVHVMARLGVKRDARRVEPGLYALGNPSPESPVFVTANFAPSFDALRSSLEGTEAYLLVLDTRGINVWCAAGKGTFGTDELVHRVAATGLRDVVSHRQLVLPQLGAPGVVAHEVKQRSAFSVEYGPVRAGDLPEYLAAGEATPEMRRVRFTLSDRLVLIPVEAVHILAPVLVAGAVLFRVLGWVASAAAIVTGLAGVALFPLLLPWLPTRAFSTKGFLLGGVAAIPFALAALSGNAGLPWWAGASIAVAYLLIMSSITAYLALNFTGSTTFSSRTGVRREIFTYVPVMAAMFVVGVVLAAAIALLQLLGTL
jgi:hypothetical protein